MARPLRIEFPGAIYHVTARGDRREDIFVDDDDRACLLNVLALGLTRFDAVALAYCLMGNHYHFVLQTRSGQLSQLMRHVNGVHKPPFSAAQFKSNVSPVGRSEHANSNNEKLATASACFWLLESFEHAFVTSEFTAFTSIYRAVRQNKCPPPCFT